MVLRLFVASAVVLAATACERIPDWELKQDPHVEQESLDRLREFKRWLWTCRGRQVQFQLNPSAEMLSPSIEKFLDRFRSAGLSVVEEANEKVILGTAFLWDVQGHLLTLRHWADQTADIECSNGITDWKPATKVGEDKSMNLELLKVDLGEDRSSFRTRNRWQAREGRASLHERLYVLASSYVGVLDRFPVYPQVFRSSFYTTIDEGLLLFTPNVPGILRGGVLVDEEAKVIGYLYQSGELSWGSAVRIDYLEQLVKSMIQTGKVTRPYLGMILRFSEDLGFQVQEIEVSGPAYQAGLRVGDVLTSWDSKKLGRIKDWPQISDEMKNRSVPISYRRQDRQIQTELRVGLSN